MNETSHDVATSEAASLAIVGAASAIGIRPYEEGGKERELARTPAVLRELGLGRLAALDLGDVHPPPYSDFARRPGAVRNEPQLLRYLPALGARVEQALSDGHKALVLGGDCSIILGSLLGATAGDGPVGLVYIDGHADFATPAESSTGSAASMCLALAVGRGESPLARLRGPEPLVRGDDVVLIGRRDEEESYEQEALEDYGLLDVTGARLHEIGPRAAAAVALERMERPELEGFWIHLDADVIDPSVMPAVDSPEPNGPGIEDLYQLLAPLVRHPRALGLQVTIYDPALDPDRSAGSALVSLLLRAFAAASPIQGAA